MPMAWHTAKSWYTVEPAHIHARAIVILTAAILTII